MSKRMEVLVTLLRRSLLKYVQRHTYEYLDKFLQSPEFDKNLKEKMLEIQNETSNNSK